MQLSARSQWIGIAVVITLLFGLLIAVMEQWKRAESEKSGIEIDARLERIRAAGHPVTSDDLAKLYPDPPPERDSSALLSLVLDQLEIHESPSSLLLIDGTALPRRGEAMSPSLKTDLMALMEKNAEAIANFPDVSLGGAWFGCGFSAGFANLPVSRLSKVGELVRFLCLQAILEAGQDRSADAALALACSFVVIEGIRSDKFLHHLARRAWGSLTCTVTELVLNQTSLSDADLQVLEGFLAEDYPSGLQEALINLRCFQIWQMEEIRRDPYSITQVSRSTGWKDRIISWWRVNMGRVYRDGDFILLLERMESRINAVSLPPKERVQALEELIPGIRRDGQRTTTALQIVEGTQNMYPGRARLDLEMLAKMRVTRASLAVERWRQAHDGRLPETLQELLPAYIPSIPVDPFTDHHCVTGNSRAVTWFTALARTSLTTAARSSQPRKKKANLTTSPSRSNGEGAAASRQSG